MAAKGGLFAISKGPPAPPEDDDTLYDVSDDALPAPEDEESGGEHLAGPFDAYAETVFSDADPATKADALRQAIECVLEERGFGGAKGGR